MLTTQSPSPPHLLAKQVNDQQPQQDEDPEGVIDEIEATPPTDEKKKKSGWRNRYTEYVTQEQVEKGLANGTLYEGLLRINAYNRREAYVTIRYQNVNRDVFVNGEVARNRALDCDRVIVQLADKKRRRENSASADLTNADAREDEEPKQEPKPVKNLLDGKVVALSQAGHRTDYAGFLRSTRDNGQILPTDKYVLFMPLEKRVPRMLIPLEECLSFATQGTAQDMYVAKCLRWSASSNFPLGRFVRHLGKIGDPDSEILAALVENGFDLNVVNYPDISHTFTNWSIPQEELQRRVDLREERVFSVDPETAKDLDDAISITRNEFNYRIGVHIADVSYFVTPGSDIDKEAASRTTSVYLPFGKVIPMLPTVLSDDLCSLHEGVDRLTFSVFFDLDENGNLDLESSELVKSVIRSKARLSYEEAQKKIDEDDQDEISKDLRDLNRITANRRNARLSGDDLISRLNRRQNGSIFSIDDDLDKDCATHSRSHELIEELMLIANYIAATKMLESNFGESALLRVHPKPSERRLGEFIELFSSRFDKVDESAQMLDFMRHELNRCTSLAKYVLTSDCADWSHFGLQLAHYTHFSSPIRRYSDLMVHRLLNQAIGYDQPTMRDIHHEKQILEQCNTKRGAAKRAEEQSNKALVRAMIASQPTPADAVVARVAAKSLQVYVPKLGEMVRINLENEKVKFDKKDKVITFQGDDEYEVQVTQFDVLSVELFVRDGASPIPEVAARIVKL
jgi:VacB/RNase II family 3'-5' exoribonuclease